MPSPTLPAPLPCPFCKGEPDIDGKSESVRVRCLKCGALGSARYFSSDDYDAMDLAELEAVTAWNTRHVAA